MHTDRERTPPHDSRRTEASDELFDRIAQAYEATPADVERIKLRARSGARPVRDPGLRILAVRVAMATAATLLLAVGLWRFSPDTTSPTLDHPTKPAVADVRPSPAAEREKPALVISNASGFVTVQAEGSQWIVLPGDTP